MKMNKMLLAFIALGSLAGSYAHALTDAEIADVLKTANQAEIDAAKVAEKKSSNSDVKAFADHMISDHSANLKEEKKTTKEAKIQAQSNDVSTELKKGAQAQLAELKTRTGSEFDKAYIDNQVAMHQQLLTDLNQTYIPAASNPEFKAYLEATKNHVQKHLSKAQEIQGNLMK